jgi:hypothetical protein
MEECMNASIRSLVFLIAILVGLVLVASPAVSQEGPMLQVVAVQVKGDGSDYIAKLKTGIPIMMKHGASAVRVFRATVAGPNSGTIFVSVEYPNAEAWAKGGPKMAADADWQKVIKKLEATGRVLTSNSLLQDVTPK